MSSLPQNYVNSISKILERLFLSRLNSHGIISSTSTSFCQLIERCTLVRQLCVRRWTTFYLSSDSGKCTLLVSLDLNAAFDTTLITTSSKIDYAQGSASLVLHRHGSPHTYQVELDALYLRRKCFLCCHWLSYWCAPDSRSGPDPVFPLVRK